MAGLRRVGKKCRRRATLGPIAHGLEPPDSPAELGGGLARGLRWPLYVLEAEFAPRSQAIESHGAGAWVITTVLHRFDPGFRCD